MAERLEYLLSQPLRTWSDIFDQAAVTFAEFATFSAVMPVEFSPLRKVPPADAALIGGAATAGMGIGGQIALASGVHGVVLVLAGVGGVALGAVAGPVVVVAATAVLAKKLLPWLNK